MASKKSTIKVSTLIFSVLMLATLVVGIVGLFLNFAIYANKIKDITIGLFDLESTMGIFTIIFAILSVVLAGCLFAVTLISAITGKKLKLTTLILTIATIVVSALFLVFSFVACAQLTPESVGNVADFIGVNANFALGVGPYLTFFGTILVPFLSIAKNLSK